MSKKSAIIISIIILLLIAIFLYFTLICKPSWDSMEIKDFKIASFKDIWNDYPFPAEKVNLTMLAPITSNLNMDIKDSDVYKWKSGADTYASISVIQLQNSLDSEAGYAPQQLNKEDIAGEEVYYYDYPVEFGGNQETARFYLFDENKFIFIVGGVRAFPEELIKKIVSKYPTPPTPSKLKVSLDTFNIFTSIFKE